VADDAGHPAARDESMSFFRSNFTEAMASLAGRLLITDSIPNPEMLADLEPPQTPAMGSFLAQARPTGSDGDRGHR